jgi:hypothetical protein
VGGEWVKKDKNWSREGAKTQRRPKERIHRDEEDAEDKKLKRTISGDNTRYSRNT